MDLEQGGVLPVVTVGEFHFKGYAWFSQASWGGVRDVPEKMHIECEENISQEWA